MNDMGQYLFSQYPGKWIPDTPGRRKVILDRLRTWNSSRTPARSKASPTPSALLRPGRENSPLRLRRRVLGRLDRRGRAHRRPPQPRRPRRPAPVRIHAIGFPTVFSVPGAGEQTGVQFATLMRILCRRNGGRLRRAEFHRSLKTANPMLDVGCWMLDHSCPRQRLGKPTRFCWRRHCSGRGSRQRQKSATGISGRGRGSGSDQRQRACDGSTGPFRESLVSSCLRVCDENG